MIVSCLLLYLDYSQYSGTPIPKVTVPAPQPPRQLGAAATGGGAAAAAPVENPMPLVAAPAKLPEPLASEAPMLIETAPVITVATEVATVPPPVTPAVAEAPA